MNEETDMSNVGFPEDKVKMTYRLVEPNKLINKWIKVEDRLPIVDPDKHASEYILACCVATAGSPFQEGSRYHAIDSLCQWKDTKDTSWRSERFGKGKVTHWMPLPLLPKK